MYHCTMRSLCFYTTCNYWRNIVIMQIGKLKVTLIDTITGMSPIELARLNLLKVYLGYRTCYSDIINPVEMAGCDTCVELMGHNQQQITESRELMSRVEKLIKKCVDMGHDAELEHGSLTFHVSGVSRALTHQLVRHRIASYGQQSQRYVKFDDLEVIVPDSIKNHENKRVHEEYEKLVKQIEKFYLFATKHGIPAEDARYALPNATTSAITFSMNFRSLLNFFSLRCCNRAQWEIREMANQMLTLCQNYYPVIFSDAGAKCIRLGHCPEKQMQCADPKYLDKRKRTASSDGTTKHLDNTNQDTLVNPIQKVSGLC